MIKQLRSNLGMTQFQFAAALGVSQSLITHWETGRRRPSPGLALQILSLASHHHQKITMESLYIDDTEAATDGKVPRYELRPDDGPHSRRATDPRRRATDQPAA